MLLQFQRRSLSAYKLTKQYLLIQRSAQLVSSVLVLDLCVYACVWTDFVALVRVRVVVVVEWRFASPPSDSIKSSCMRQCVRLRL